MAAAAPDTKASAATSSVSPAMGTLLVKAGHAAMLKSEVIVLSPKCSCRPAGASSRIRPALTASALALSLVPQTA